MFLERVNLAKPNKNLISKSVIGASLHARHPKLTTRQSDSAPLMFSFGTAQNFGGYI